MNTFRQHLIDPELCIRCNGCEETCGKHAICHDASNYAIDAALCDACMECVEQCPTGAVDHWQVVPANAVFDVATQFTWTSLPAPELMVPTAMPWPSHLGAPASAARPVTGRYTRESPALGRVIHNERVTSPDCETDVHHIVLDFGDTFCSVLEGQSLGVLAPGVNAMGQAHAMRVYSVASARTGEGDRAGQVALAVKRVTHDGDGALFRGVCSNYLCATRVGDHVAVVGPFGASFLMPDDPRARLLLVATGTGIAPMRAMIQRRLSVGSASADTVHVFYGGRTPGEMPYLDQLALFDGSSLTLHRAYSRLPGYTARHVQDVLVERSGDLNAWLNEPDTHIYVCGLKGMETGVLGAFQRSVEQAGGDWVALHQRLKADRRLHLETY